MARQMKDSGIEWIGEIPANWQMLRMKSCIAQRDGGAWGEEATGEEGDTICLRIADFDYARFRFKDTATDALTTRHYDTDVVQKLLLQENDILIEKSGGGEKTPVGRTVLFDKAYPALFANFMDRLRCASFVYPPFMQYLFVTFYKNDYTRNYIKQTTGIQNLDLTSMLSNEKVALPPLAEQHRIAAFLDRKCAEIDAVIERTKATIEEYKKLKQAIITEAVTKGVRGPRKMKNSGIEWIGEIPSDYNKYRIKHVTDLHGRIGFRGYTTDDMVDVGEGAITLSPSNIRDMGMNYDKCSYISWAKYHESPEIQIHNGDLLMVKTGSSYGKAALVTDLPMEATINPQLIVITNFRVVPQFLNYYFHTYILLSQIENAVVGGTIPTMAQEKINNFFFFAPSIDEQQEIVDYLDEKCAALDTLIVKKTALLTELETYKKSLIYEYVTGKKEVV